MATTTIHRKISVPPAASDSTAEFSLPLLFFDMMWYRLREVQLLSFFDFPACSKSHFLEAIVPHLQTSLSLTLAHFLPLAGKIIHHRLNPDIKPILRYQAGDSIQLTISESDNPDHFNHLTGNHPRVCDEFYAFVPNLPPATHSETLIECPVLAFQVTLFPGKGLSIGCVSHHAVADASTIVSLLQAWALVNQTRLLHHGSAADYKLIENNFMLPYYDRKTVRNLNGILETRSGAEDVADDEPEYLRFAVDCRARLSPPLPANYFGNCLATLMAELKHGQVKGKDGFVMAANAIGEAQATKQMKEKGILYGAEKWPEEYQKSIGKRQCGVWGSPRFDFYVVDYGWGRPNKFEILSIDGADGAKSLCKSREFEGGLEIGVSKPKPPMATTTIHHKISVTPVASDSTAELSLPLLLFDMMWYRLRAVQLLLFFNFPACSKSHFLETIVPGLKTSLSLTLAHFLPLAGKIIHHRLNPDIKPILRYQAGDSIQLTVFESDADFNHLTGNHPRVCDEFYAFVPNLPPATHSETTIECPVLAFQVTFFPGKGLSIGFICDHTVVDVSTVASFIRAWALVNQTRLLRHGGEDNNKVIENNLILPHYDRKTVRNLNLERRYWDAILGFSPPVEPPRVKLPINNLRSTFVVKKDDIEKLKNFVLASWPEGVAHLSSFTVVCALVWSCSAKSVAAEVADDEPEYFRFSVDCRARLSPPLPANYFGNCVTTLMAELKHGEVEGKDGFVMAANAIGEATKQMNEKGILYCLEKWPEEYRKSIGKWQYEVWGSPRFDFYAVDFGWGKANKFEIISIDSADGAITLCKSREFEGGLEIGVSKPKVQMEAFANVFNEVLSNCCVVKMFNRL
ncbi:hypothetical protein BUALT_Bualt01G0014600 [Buddleja alternifolia]|uniref:Uncharacterized protein n=1 Tax=Buddleja alternifolia TaxID=168488 RepID=A0AAV6YEB7_9LAMI|nr:hypothetical protein BUALT_Bualt01G0014600 [Buddleja alternifolia]